MTATAPVWPLQHWAGLSGRVMLKQGPRATSLTEADLDDLLIRVRKGVTGIVRRAGVALDESQLSDIRNTYFVDQDEDVEPDIDPDRYMSGFAATGSTYDEHGTVWTPGQWPMAGAL